MSTIKEVLIKKRVLKSQLTILKKKVSDSDLVTDFELANEKFKNLKVEIKEIFNSIYNLCEEEKIDSYVTEHEEINEIIDEMEFDLNRKIPKISKLIENKSESVSNSLNIENNLRLPKFSLPTFTGNMHDWLSFRDIFKASIHDNPNLSGAVKLQYLKSSLKGEAHRIIQSISIVDGNYDLAWSLLEERYSNKREQVYAHLKKFLNVPNIQNESATAILSVIDNVTECIRALEILEQKIDGFASIILAFILCQKLDVNTKVWWERHIQKESLPNLGELIEFLKNHARTLSVSKGAINPKKNVYKVAAMVTGVTNKNSKCVLCNNEYHLLENCKNYLKLPINDRIEIIKTKRLCFNCLFPHSVANCKQKNNCFCKKKHHKSIHFHKEEGKSKNENITPENKIEESNNPEIVGHSVGTLLNPNARNFEYNNSHPSTENNFVGTSVNYKARETLLSTATVFIKDVHGNLIPGKALLDNGSQSCFMTTDYADRLGLKKQKTNIAISCLNENSLTVKSKLFTDLSNGCDYVRSLEFLIVPKISELVPGRYFKFPFPELPKGIKLADTEFNKPKKIDILLGSECFYDLLKTDKFQLMNSNLIFQNSVFGYIIGGSILQTNSKNNSYCGFTCKVKDELNLDDALRQFWEIEQVDTKQKFKSIEEQACNRHFLETYKRNASGRFVVQMPLKMEPNILGDSKEFASKCLNLLWKRLEKNPVLKSLYCQFMLEYEKLGHMEEVIESEEPKIAFYFPHHAIYRPDKSTTKLRVVFNGSHVTSNGKCLNSLQLNGGVIQEDLFSIVLRFRTYRFVFIADIKMMYRMILIDECQRDLQRILWKSGSNEQVKTYRLCTVTYGTTSAPYLAMRCLKQLADDNREKYPTAAEAIESSFYMDDILTGADDIDTVKKLQMDLIEIFKSCGMELHKWCFNTEELMKSVNKNENYTFHSLETKALGLLWRPEEDTFSFKVEKSEQTKVTKRSVISVIARIFDPLGLIGPVVTKAKIFLQKLWRLHIDWDQLLPKLETDEWLQFTESLRAINDINIDRYMMLQHPICVSLVGFSDASEKAYGAALYIVVRSTEKFSSKLVCSKSRVAPIKTITIARMELCAAVILVKLMRKVVNILNIPKNSVYFYTDSTIVLGWIRKQPSDLKTFVASRVTQIQELSDASQWRHVISKENPADIISRGMDPIALKSCSLWWNGPTHLLQDLTADPCSLPQLELDFVEYKQELKVLHLLCPKNSETSDFLSDFFNCTNNFLKLIRIFAFLFRFINNCKIKIGRRQGPISIYEFNDAEKALLRIVQQKEFPEEVNCLKKGKNLKHSSKLRGFNVFLDSENLIRIGGRIQHSDLEYSAKHPIILPKQHRISRLICDHYHKKYFHIGPQTLLHFIRQKYWIISGRNLARKVVHECVICCKARPVTTEQIMGNLPKERVTPSFAFHYTGVDFTGPFFIKYKGQRKGTLHKIYIALFICLATKAIHLEIVSDLTAESFIETLKRFIARRGKCAKLFSDNATNFVGAHNEIKRLHKLVSYPDEILSNYLCSEAMDWQFIPPKSPHFGGLWESGVKSVKHHLKRAIGDSKLIYEEFLTVIVQIEGILNSRPISPLSSDPKDLDVLTPGHFLIGRPINSIIEPNLVQFPNNRLKRWEIVRKIVQIIWKKWSIDYLNNLQQRNKWFFARENLCVNQMVLIKENNLPCCKWLLGRIVEVYPGSDERVRIVKVKTSTGELKRPVTKLCVLPIQP